MGQAKKLAGKTSIRNHAPTRATAALEAHHTVHLQHDNFMLNAASFTYRRATPADLLTICELAQQLHSLHHEARPDIYAPATAEFARDQALWLPSLDPKNEATQAAFLAQRGNLAVGFVTAVVLPQNNPILQPLTVCRIGSIVVLEAHRGCGVGGGLMRLAESWGAGLGATDFRLNVWKFNEPASRLYEDLGYEVRAFELGKRLGG
jgi:ribosomal protein S18 acetylase RimI-like enzyme